MSETSPSFKRFVAIGDSFAEGVGDVEPRCPNGVRGWADRVAEVMAREDPEFRYANLAIRGRLMPAVLGEQLEPALAMKPDLATICAGANDLLRPSVDIDALIESYDAAVGRLQDAGATVIAFTAYDTGGKSVFGALRGRFAVFNELLREVVEERNLVLVDFWRMRIFRERRMWEFDRMHMSSAGHVYMAIEVLRALGIEHDLVPVDFGPAQLVSPTQRRREGRQWTVEYAIPWVGRRLRGVSTGDTIAPKYPELTAMAPSAD
ncbi:SGNH/GDSL hydrolase family protein [Williamsia muralis]|jgi:lysophospholipase L1-like esterase|uniref:Lysophospholipase L1-like esterase n=1 Tax=Williamsia marianensis TaxID=85044 RepID=A0A315S974_WILMA|nr:MULTISPECIES: SGNH/GDSL hydrolase family protein [Williamsia]MDV7133995.1 SGNH/GDSL hydrolase family protein [Williamsia muralis]PVY31266.1 lysophospholipase L1-like esterase [Williamsia marianensis]RKR96052.1 lysophospholipase L1-like esterase [Williamsia muralis]